MRPLILAAALLVALVGSGCQRHQGPQAPASEAQAPTPTPTANAAPEPQAPATFATIPTYTGPTYDTLFKTKQAEEAAAVSCDASANECMAQRSYCLREARACTDVAGQYLVERTMQPETEGGRAKWAAADAEYRRWVGMADAWHGYADEASAQEADWRAQAASHRRAARETAARIRAIWGDPQYPDPLGR